MDTIGRYEILGEIGRGSMGIVYLAQDPHLLRKVALKTFVLPPGMTEEQGEDFRERFCREAQAAALIAHPGIVTIFDAGTDLATGIMYIAMEYVDGRSLRQVLQEAGGLPRAHVFAMGDTLAEALATAHEAGIVHRDIKPANILVRKLDGGVKIVDFGVARMPSSELTAAGDRFGSPAYMSPEQFRGMSVDGRSDLFSLAVILYQALAGQRPFAGEEVSTLAYTVVHVAPEPLSNHTRGLPRALDRFFDKALAKDPDDRFQDGLAFKRALASARQGKSAISSKATEAWVRARELTPRAGSDTLSTREKGFAAAMLALVVLPVGWAFLGGGLSSAPGDGTDAASAVAMALEQASEPKTPDNPERSARGGSRSDAEARSKETLPAASPRERTNSSTDRLSRSAAPESAVGSPAGPGPRTAGTEQGQRSGIQRKLDADRSQIIGTGSHVELVSAPKRVSESLAARAAPPSRPRSVPAPPPKKTTGETAAVASAPEPPKPAEARVASLAVEQEDTPAWLMLDGTSRVKEGRLVVYVDGKEIYSRELSTERAADAGDLQRTKWLRRKEEAFQARIEIPPGRHEVMVRVLPSGKDAVYEDRTTIEVGEAESRELKLMAGKVIGPPLTIN